MNIPGPKSKRHRRSQSLNDKDIRNLLGIDIKKFNTFVDNRSSDLE